MAGRYTRVAGQGGTPGLYGSAVRHAYVAVRYAMVVGQGGTPGLYGRAVHRFCTRQLLMGVGLSSPPPHHPFFSLQSAHKGCRGELFVGVLCNHLPLLLHPLLSLLLHEVQQTQIYLRAC